MNNKEVLRYWGGSAHSKELGGSVLILLIASNEQDALLEYYACLERYPSLIRDNSPKIGEACNIGMFLEDKELYHELQTYNSVPVLRLSNLD